MINREEYERDLKERQRKHLESIRGTVGIGAWGGTQPWKPCLHDSCSQCHGTGWSLTGPCFHSLSCDCPKCSAYSLSSTVPTNYQLNIKTEVNT